MMKTYTLDDVLEVKKYTYEEMPEFTMDGVRMIETTGDEIQAEYFPDVEYAAPDGHVLHLQIMRPHSRNEMNGKHPCFVYVQGSGWMKQHVHKPVPTVAKMAEKGYVTVIVEYRHSGIAKFPACAVDARNAVRFLRVHADEYGIDPENMFLTGCSSGGHTAVFGGLIHDDDSPDNLFPGVSAEVKAIVDYYGSVSVMLEDANPTTLDHCLETSPEGMEAGHINLRENPEMRRAMSAECNIDEDTVIAPVLILHGTKDRIVNCKQSAILYNRLKETGHEAELILVKGADHGGGEFFNEECMDAVDAFLRKHM